VGGLARPFSLVKKETKGMWLSYPLSGTLVLFMGLFVVVSWPGVFQFEGFGGAGQRMEEYYNDYFSDYLFLVVCAFLGVNAVSGTCVTLLMRDRWRVTFSPWGLPALKRLPLTADRIVGSRLISILTALTFNATVFFVAAYCLTDLGDLGRSYLWFAGIWLGFSLLAAGLYLVSELTVPRSGKADVLLSSIGFALSLIVFVALLEWTLEPTLIESTAKLAESHGALAATFSILAGSVDFALLSWLTTHRIKKWGLSI
jgi:hypothetical protein